MDVAPCRCSGLNRRFGGSYRLHLQGRKIREAVMHLWLTAPRPVGLYSPHSPEFPPDRSYTGSRQLPADLHRPFPTPLCPLTLPDSSYRAGSFRLVASSAATCSRWFFARGFYYPEDGGDTVLRNVGSIHYIYTAPHPRRRHSS
jgi:hypothetical protein